MTQQKSPGGNQGKEKGGTETMPVLYPATPAAVNNNCASCGYFRTPEPKRGKSRVFCMFTGVDVLPGQRHCDFFTVEEVAHAER